MNNIPNNPTINVETAGNTGLFCNYIYKAIPLAFDESMSYYECLCGLRDYLKNTIIPTVNNNADAVTELQNLYAQLNSYVTNYFNNLDVQQEINNKLDEMVSDGTLNNIINNQIFSDINNKLDNLTNTVNTLTLPKKYLLIGDSYGEGYTPDGIIESWAIKFKNKMNLNDNNCIISAQGGYGFAVPNKKFYDLINAIPNDNAITDIIILGGYNDNPYSYTEINNGINDCNNLIKNKFPNANFHIGMIGWAKRSDYLLRLFNIINYYRLSCTINQVKFIENIEYSLHDYFEYFSSDNFHPNENGQEYIANNLVYYITNNNLNIVKSYVNIDVTFADNIIQQDVSTKISESMINNLISFAIKEQITLECNNLSMTGNGKDYLIGSLTKGFVIGNTNKTINIPLNIIIKNENIYYNLQATLKIYNGNLYLSFYKINDTGLNYQNYASISQIQIFPTSISIISNIN